MDRHDIQQVLDYIVSLWPRAGKNFGEAHQQLLVGRIRNFHVSFDPEAKDAIGEVCLTVKSFGGPAIDEIYKRLKGIHESKYRAATVWKVEEPPKHEEHKTIKEWADWYTDPLYPERLDGMSEKEKRFYQQRARSGKFLFEVKSVNNKGNNDGNSRLQR